METKAKLPKKLLSMFLAALMIFSACYVGIDGAYTAYAAVGDSAYSHNQVLELMNKAIDLGDGKYYSSQSSTTDEVAITGDNGEILAAAEAIYDYAVKTYRVGKGATDDGNSTARLLEMFVAEFGPDYPGNTPEESAKANAALALATDILNPAGTTVYAHNNKALGTRWTFSKSETDYHGQDVTTTIGDSYFNSSVKDVAKKVSIKINLESYLTQFTSIADIPATIIAGVDYTYSHTVKKEAIAVKTKTNTSTCSSDTYDGYADPYSWHYMSGKPVRIITKDKTTKKQLLAFEKYFNPDRLAMSVEQLVALKPEKLAEELTDSQGYWEAIQTTFSKKIIEHFGMSYIEMEAYVKRVEKASNVVNGMNAIDNLNSSINTPYDATDYSQMAALHAKATGALEGVKKLNGEVLDFILNEMEYSEEYASATELVKDADSYIATLYADMMKQHLIDKTKGMQEDLAKYEGKLDKDNFKTPTDPEVEGLLGRVNAANAVVNNPYYANMDYYNEYYAAKQYGDETLKEAWEKFVPVVKEVAEVRDLKGIVTDYYNYFMPILDTNLIVDLSNSDAMDYYTGMADKLLELKSYYSDIEAEWGTTVAMNIFTVDGALLQNRVDAADDGALNVLKESLIARTKADIDDICTMNAAYASKDVNFDNFAEVKTALSSFDYVLYSFVNEQGWLEGTGYIEKYSQWDALLGKYQEFTLTNGKSDFDENFTYAENGIYAERPAKQLVTVEGEDENGNPISYETYIYYDIAREGAEDNYVVTEPILSNTAAKLDGFLASRDFGALLGFVDEETEEAADLKTYVNQMINNMLFTDDLINSLIEMIYPMVCDLLITTLPTELQKAVGEPTIPNATATLNTQELLSLSGYLHIYLDDDEKGSEDDNIQGRNQKYLYEVFEELELFVYPRSFAKHLNMSNPAEFKAGNELYDALMAADRDWKYFEAKEDIFDENGEIVAAAGEIYIDYQWNINGDRDNFIDAATYIFDSILPLLQVLFKGRDFSEQVQKAAYVWGNVNTLWNNQLGGWGILTLTVNCFTADSIADDNADNNVKFLLWDNLIVPLFQVLGVTNIPSLSTTFSSEEFTNALFKTLFNRVDEILAAPLDSILSILPNLVYFLSMDSVQEALDNLNLDLNLGIGVEINTADSGLIGDIASIANLDNITSFGLPVSVADLIRDEGGLYGLLGAELSDLNSLLQMVVPMLGIEGLTLPEISQKELIFCSDWETRADGSVNLVANKADLIYWFLNFIVEVIADGKLLNALLSGEISLGGEAEGETGEENKELDPNIKALIEKLVKQFTENPDHAVAALVELLNPVKYEDNLQSMDWVESQYNYGEPVIEGVNAMSALYLNYGTDWTEEMANKLVDDIDELLPQILEMAKLDLEGAADLGEFLQNKINALFTNETITELVKMLGGFGDSASAVIEDLVKNQVGIDITSWFTAFGYLFPEGTWKEDAEIIRPGTTYYKNDFGVEGVLNEDGTISWSVNKLAFADGNATAFIDIVVRLLGPAKLLIDFLFAGKDISAFTGAVTLKGYETYATTLGLLLDTLGVQNLPTQADFNADSMGSLSNMLYVVLDWFYALTSSEDMVAQILELIPDLFYYIESNGLSVLLHNLLMPVWVLIDTVRPLLDVRVDGLLSMIVSEILNGKEFSTDAILEYVMTGHYNMEGENYKPIHIELKNLRLSDIIAVFDSFLGTNLATSGLVEIGINGFCSGIVDNKTTVTAADAITLLVNGLLDCLEQPSDTEGLTNGAVICNFVQKMLVDKAIADGKPASEVMDIPALYASIMKIFKGVDVEYQTPDWGYLTKGYNLFDLTAPQPTIAYLAYQTDWTETTANNVYASLAGILDMVLPMVSDDLKEGTLKTLIDGILAEKVYSDAVLKSLLETIVNLIGDFSGLLDLADGLLGTSVSAWFEYDEETGKGFCQLQDVLNEETGETEQKWVCVKNFGIDTAEDKATAFIDALGTVLEPVNALLSWLFFGDSYEFFTSTKKVEGEDGEYEFVPDGAVITLSGGRGYAKGLAPILSALGLTVKAETAYAITDAQGKVTGYKAVDALKDILGAVLGLLDELATSEDAVKLVFNLLPNLIYFINANGLVTSVNNLLAPVNGVIEAIAPILGDTITVPEGKKATLGALLGDNLPIDIENITLSTLLNLARGYDVVIAPEIEALLSKLYVGKLAQFTGADGLNAYRLDVTGAEGDVLTIVLSLAIEIFKTNETLFAELLKINGKDGADVYAAILKVMAGFEVILEEANWGYMYNDNELTDEEAIKADKEASLATLNASGFPATSFAYLAYQTDWTEATANNVYAQLDEILGMVLPMALKDSSDLKTLVEGILEKNVYSDAVLKSVIEMAVNAIGDYQAVLGAADALLGTNVSSWFTDFCELQDVVDEAGTVQLDENGNPVQEWVCTYDFGIDAAATEEKGAKFVESVVKVLEPADALLAWLFFGEDYTFFNGSKKLTDENGNILKDEDGNDLYEVLITLNGGRGYAYAIAPILEALGLDMKPELEYLGEDGKYNVSVAIGDILTALLKLVANLNKNEYIIGFVFDLLPNLIYFINADGLKTSVNNLLAPVSELFETISIFFPENMQGQDIAGLINGFLPADLGLDIANITTEALLKLLTAKLGITLNDEQKNVINNIYGLGTAAKTDFGYKVNVTDKYDVLTVLLSFAIELFKENDAVFAPLVGADIYATILNVIGGFEVTLNEINWAYMYETEAEKEAFLEAETPAFPATELVYLDYFKTDWTEATAESVYGVLDEVLELVLPMVLKDNKNLNAIVEELLVGKVYSDKVLTNLLEMIVNAIGDFQVAIAAADALLGTNVNSWFEDFCDYDEANDKWICNYNFGIDEAATVEEKGEKFVKAVGDVLRPANALLAWLFFGENYTFFDASEPNKALITLNGGRGYAYAIAPILEALGLDMKPESAYLGEDGKYDVALAVEDILNAVLGLVKELNNNEYIVEFVFKLIPNILYFINADGLKVSVNNLIAPVNDLFKTISVFFGDDLAGKDLGQLINGLLPENIAPYLDITNITTESLLNLLDKMLGFKLTPAMEDVIKNIYAVGTAAKTESGMGYKVVVEGYDVLTVLLSFALDALNTNPELFSDLLGKETYEAVVALIKGADGFSDKYLTPDWDYMYKDGGSFTTSFGASQYLPKYEDNDAEKYEAVINYLRYANNWNEDTADYVLEVVDQLVQSFFESDSSLGHLTEKAIADGLYQEDLLHSLLETVVGLIYDYAEIIEGAGALLGAESIKTWWTDYCEVSKDSEGNTVVKVTHNFGIDDATTVEAKRNAFVAAFVEVLEPAYDILAWLLFGEDFTFFNSADGKSVLITLKGAKGYANALVPLFEAVGAKMTNATQHGYTIGNYVDGKSGLIPESEFRKSGTLDMAYAVESIFTALTGWLDMICGELKPGEDGKIANNLLTAMLDILPNFIYNLNAGTLDVVVKNLLLPVEAILEHLGAFGVELDIMALLQDLGITSLDWYGVFSIVEELVHLYWPENIQDFLANLYLGKLVCYESANGEAAYFTTYNEDEAAAKDYLETSIADMTTILISFVLDGALDKRNAPQLRDWLGEDIYNVIYKFLSKDIEEVPMQDFDWILTDKAGTHEVLSPITLGGVESLYGELYTREMGQYIETFLPSFVDTMIVLLGIQAEDGTTFEGLEDVLNDLIGSSLYTKANLEAILEAIQGLIPTLKDALGAELYDIIVNVLDKALGINLNHFNEYVIADFADGDREAFVTGLVEMLEPVYPILSWLLTDEELIALFHTADGSDAIVVEGANGYAYGIVPLLEAFDYDNEKILDPDAYKAASQNNPELLLRNILDPILNVVDQVLADPVNEIFNVLPAVIYFLNSNGLDTVIRNTLNAVVTVLHNIEPLTDGLTVEKIYEMIGFNGKIDIVSLLEGLLKGIEEDTGFQFTDVAMDAITTLTVGEVISFETKNGFRFYDQPDYMAYTMQYVPGADRVDMVTTVLRAALTFISVPQNVAALEGILKDSLDEEGYKFVCSLLENFSQMAASEGGMDEIMYTVYQIFYAANVAAHSTEDWLGEFNGDYSFLNQLFATSDLEFLRQLEASLGDLLNKYTGDIIDDDEVVPNGFIAFFQKIAEFFKKIGEFFKNLFK